MWDLYDGNREGEKMRSMKKTAALMHVTAMEKGTAFRMWDGLMLKLFYRDDDIVLCVWKQNEMPTDYDVYITKLNFFGNSREISEARKGRFVWIKINRLKRCGHRCGY